MRLNHVALIVNDRERSARFYADYFGLAHRLHEDDHLLILGDETHGLLALSEGDPPPDLGRLHFGFLVASPATALATREKLKVGGVTELEFEESGGFVRVQVADPDGYRVEVYSF